MTHTPLVTDYTEADEVPEAVALAAIEGEDPFATLENYNHHDDIGLVGVANMYHIERECEWGTEEAVVVEVTTTPSDGHDDRQSVFTHAVSSRYDASEPEKIPDYLDRLHEVADMQTDQLDYREAEWQLREVDDAYAEFFEDAFDL